MATVSRPTFHVRNLIGGVQNNTYINVRSRDYAWVNSKMIRLRKLTKKMPFEDALASEFSAADAAILRDMRDYGVMNASFSRVEFGQIGPGSQSRWPLSSTGPLVRAGALSMETVEDFLRTSAFVRWYDELGPAAAADMSLLVHFDYRNLTNMEESVKKLVPFFVWTRRNLPLQLQAIVERPDLIQRYSHLMHGMSDQYQMEPYDNMPGNPYGSALSIDTGIVFGADTPFWARAILSPDLPLTDLEALGDPMNPTTMMNPTTWLNFITATMGPHVTLPFTAGAQAEYGSVNAPGGLAQGLLLLNKLGLYDNVSESGDPRMPRELRNIVETAIPPLGEYTRMFDTDPARAQRLGIGEDRSLGDTLRGAGLQLARGVGVRTETPHDAYGSSFAVADELTELIKELRLRGVLPQEP